MVSGVHSTDAFERVGVQQPYRADVERLAQPARMIVQ